MESQEEEPEFVAAAQNEHHAVALFDSLIDKEVCRALRGYREVAEGKDVAFVVVVAPDQCFALGFGLGVFIDHVVGEVEIVRDGKLKVLVQVLVGTVLGAL